MSRLSDQSKVLAQRQAILEERVSRAEASGALRPPEKPVPEAELVRFGGRRS